MITGSLLSLGHMTNTFAQEDNDVAVFNEVYRNYRALSEQGNWEEALPEAERALELGLAMNGEEHRNTAALRYNYSINLLQLNRTAEAAEQFAATLGSYRAVYGNDAEELFPVYMDAGRAQVLDGDDNGASGYFRQAMDIIEGIYGDNSFEYARMSLECGRILLDEARSPNARRFLLESQDVFNATLGADDFNSAYASYYLGKFYVNTDDFRRAEPLLLASLPVVENNGEDSLPTAVAIRAMLVAVFEETSRSEESTPHLLAIARLAAEIGDEDPVAPIYQTAAEYPSRAARQATEDHSVTVEFDIDAEGFVTNAQVTQNTGEDAYAQAALESVERYRYAPGLIDGEPAARENIEYSVRFPRPPPRR